MHFAHVRGRLRRRSIRAVRAVGRLVYTKAGRIVTKNFKTSWRPGEAGPLLEGAAERSEAGGVSRAKSSEGAESIPPCVILTENAAHRADDCTSFAYGGIEAVGGLVDKTENPKKNFPKGIVTAAMVIVVGYALLIMLVGSFTNYSEILGTDSITLGNVSYVIMSNFAAAFGKAFGASAATQVALAHGFARVYALIMLLALMGALFTLVYSPLKQLIDGTPKELWPGKMGEIAEDGMPKNAMWVQCTIVCVMVLLVSFGGDTMQQFFLILTAMVNVGMTVPYMFISFAFPKFKKMEGIDRSFVVYKTQKSANFWGYVVTLTLLLANTFAIIQPALDGDIKTTFWSLSGPVIFGLVAWIIYTRYEKRVANGKIASEDVEETVAEAE